MNIGIRVILRLCYLIIMIMPNVFYSLSFYDPNRSFGIVDVFFIIANIIVIYNLVLIIREVKQILRYM